MDENKERISGYKEGHMLKAQLENEQIAASDTCVEAYNRRMCWGKNNSRRFSLLRLTFIVTMFILLYSCSHHVFPKARIDPLDQQFQSLILANGGNGSMKVPLEAHIMSKCPDAKDCLRDLIVPAMEKISDKVNFTLSFIGR